MVMKKIEKEKQIPSSRGHQFSKEDLNGFGSTFPSRCSLHRDRLLTEGGHLEIFVKVMCQEIYITLAVDPNDSIANLKSIIKVKKGFPVDEQRIVYNGRKLEDDRTVSDYNIQNKSTLNLVLPVPGRPNGDNRMEVTILTKDRGPLATLAVRPTDLILELKLKIRGITGVPYNKQILNFADRELENRRFISDYSIQNKSVIDLVVEIEVYVVTSLPQKRMALELKSNDTIRSVKDKIRVQTKISPYQQVLLFNGKQLDDVHSLNYYNIENKSTLFLYVTVEIIVTMSTGTDVRLNLFESNTIKNVKERIQLSEDIPCDMQRLYFLSRLLEDGSILSDYGIQNGCILNCDVISLIRICVKMPSEDVISVNISPDDKVRSIIDRIQASHAIPPDQLSLVYNGEKLNNRFTLRHYKLGNGSVLDTAKSEAVAIDYRIGFLTQKPRATSSSQNDPGEECLRSERSLSSTQEIMNNVAKRYLKTENPSNREELDKFVAYMEKVRKVIVVDVKTGSLIFTLECGSVQILDELWEDYSTGHLNEVAQYYLVTNDILEEFGLSSLKLTSNIKEKDYTVCRRRLVTSEANQMLDRLRKELLDAFRHWLPVRRNTKGKLEELARNLPSLLRKPDVSFAAKVGFALGVLAAPFTSWASLMGAAAEGGSGAAIGADMSYLSAEDEEKLGLPRVQAAIDEDLVACARLKVQLDIIDKTFTSSTEIFASAGATVGAMVRTEVFVAVQRASRFADCSVLPRDITQLVTTSLDRHRGSTSATVDEISGILSNLKCPDETEIQRLVPESLID